jgi:hypothetical protein
MPQAPAPVNGRVDARRSCYGAMLEPACVADSTAAAGRTGDIPPWTSRRSGGRCTLIQQSSPQ